MISLMKPFAPLWDNQADPTEEWFYLLIIMRTFALNPKGVPSCYHRILERARLAGLTEEQIKAL